MVLIVAAPAWAVQQSDETVGDLARIEAMRAAAHATSGAADHESELRAEAERREAIITAIDALLTTRPDHPQRDRLAVIRLQNRFLVETLRGNAMPPFETELRAVIAASPAPAVRAEADYWLLRLEMERQRRTPTTQPTGRDDARPIREFVRRHPDSPRVPSLVARLADDAYARGDFADVDRLLETLSRHFPEHVVTLGLKARDRLFRARGAVWNPILTSIEGRPMDWQAVRGRPTLMLFWASWDRLSREALLRLDRRRFHNGGDGDAATTPPAFHLICVSLDSDPAVAGRFFERHAINAPLACDGRGWDGDFVRTWPVHRLPTIFVLDADTRFVDVANDVDAALRLMRSGSPGPVKP
ncbi:MAG: TlpA disulfide reductase family protein [Phycisphaerae bacterium]